MDALLPIAIGLSFILSIVACIVGTIVLVRYLLKPIELRAIQQPLETLRFRLIDAICLAVQCQLLLAVGAAMDRRASAHGRPGLLMAVVLSALALAIWCGSVTTLNRARIHTSARRALFILIQTPLSFVSAFVAAVSGSYLAIIVLWLALWISERGDLVPVSVLLVTLSVFLGSLPFVVTLRQTANWIAAEPMVTAVDKKKPGESKDPPRYDGATSPGDEAAAAAPSAAACDRLNHSDALAGTPK